jgi:uridylate kinase
MTSTPFKRILLKLSGEALRTSDSETIIDTQFTTGLAQQVKSVVDLGIQVAIVVGGGNIFRGSIGESLGMDRIKGDYMGMLATVINALAIGSALESVGQAAEVQSAVANSSVVHRYSQPLAKRALEDGRVVIIGGGTGNPYFSTDTASALRAVELDCNALFKATKVDGVYSDDPVKVPEARRYERLSFEDVLVQNLRVMDQTAFSLCRDNRLPIIVFNLYEEGNILKAAKGETVGTLVTSLH